jgi:hypothetical protein
MLVLVAVAARSVDPSQASNDVAPQRGKKRSFAVNKTARRNNS